MTDTKVRTLDTIQLNRQKLNLQSYPKPKKQFVCLYGKKNIRRTWLIRGTFFPRRGGTSAAAAA